MTGNNIFDVIIVGGSYSGLAAGMALGRALKNVLIIDSGKPCNRQTPYSHNFITHDGDTPAEIAALANLQVRRYDTVKFFDGLATSGIRTEMGFEIRVVPGEIFTAKKLIFATGIRDIMPGIDGVEACWGISVLHCPYCHGYELRNEKTGILGNGEYGFDFSKLISNWTKDLTLFTNGTSILTTEQTAKIERHHIKIVEKEIEN
ncbi:MAG: NAD(P)/FAD-dependent oxidoreductase [Bacteroidota bacterium]